MTQDARSGTKEPQEIVEMLMGYVWNIGMAHVDGGDWTREQFIRALGDLRERISLTIQADRSLNV